MHINKLTYLFVVLPNRLKIRVLYNSFYYYYVCLQIAQYSPLTCSQATLLGENSFQALSTRDVKLFYLMPSHATPRCLPFSISFRQCQNPKKRLKEKGKKKK